MASDRLVRLFEADIKSFSEEQKNVNTQKKTLYDLKLQKIKIHDMALRYEFYIRVVRNRILLTRCPRS